jgi:hypothetical protein
MEAIDASSAIFHESSGKVHARPPVLPRIVGEVRIAEKEDNEDHPRERNPRDELVAPTQYSSV